MGKHWDHDHGGRENWTKAFAAIFGECLRVLKPGAHGLVWALPRTSHWTATALEDAGFEVRDVVTHLFGTGFPKSRNISKDFDKGKRAIVGTIEAPGMATANVLQGAQGRTTTTFKKYSDQAVTDLAKRWNGWGTALKPASEHWILVRKPLDGSTVAANVLEHSVGALNIDECRIEGAPRTTHADGNFRTRNGGPTMNEGFGLGQYAAPSGRWPANLTLDEEAAALLDEQSGELTSGRLDRSKIVAPNKTYGVRPTRLSGTYEADSGGASRFFYVAKASKKDRGAGNTHPTVKSTELMRYFCRLVTPPEGTILDPFAGSGSTLIAALLEGFSVYGIEREAEYIAIARTRVEQCLQELQKGVA
jgi:site-specific DNA-methyltransferase (adenine-specific)